MESNPTRCDEILGGVARQVNRPWPQHAALEQCGHAAMVSLSPPCGMREPKYPARKDIAPCRKGVKTFSARPVRIGNGKRASRELAHPLASPVPETCQMLIL